MFRQFHGPFLAAALLGLAGTGVAAGQGATTAPLEAELALLKRQNATLRESLVAANRREKESADALSKIKLRLEALGKNLLDGEDDRLVEAVSDLQVLDRRVSQLEEAALRLSARVQAYLKTAIASDPDARAQLEAELRELDVTLGLRARPEKNVARGNLQHATVVSIDSESGLVVLNVGEREGARIGLNFNIMRGDELIAEAMVADIEADVCGLFVQRLANSDNPVRFKDTAALKVD